MKTLSIEEFFAATLNGFGAQAQSFIVILAVSEPKGSHFFSRKKYSPPIKIQVK